MICMFEQRLRNLSIRLQVADAGCITRLCRRPRLSRAICKSRNALLVEAVSLRVLLVHGNHKLVVAERTALVLLAHGREVLVERRVAVLAHECHLVCRRRRQPVVACQFKVALGAVEPAATAWSLERKLIGVVTMISGHNRNLLHVNEDGTNLCSRDVLAHDYEIALCLPKHSYLSVTCQCEAHRK